MALRIVLLEVDRANLDKNLHQILHEDSETLRSAALSLNDICSWLRNMREAPAEGVGLVFPFELVLAIQHALEEVVDRQGQ